MRLRPDCDPIMRKSIDTVLLICYNVDRSIKQIRKGQNIMLKYFLSLSVLGAIVAWFITTVGNTAINGLMQYATQLGL